MLYKHNKSMIDSGGVLVAKQGLDAVLKRNKTYGLPGSQKYFNKLVNDLVEEIGDGGKYINRAKDAIFLATFSMYGTHGFAYNLNQEDKVTFENIGKYLNVVYNELSSRKSTNRPFLIDMNSNCKYESAMIVPVIKDGVIRGIVFILNDQANNSKNVLNEIKNSLEKLGDALAVWGTVKQKNDSDTKLDQFVEAVIKVA